MKTIVLTEDLKRDSADYRDLDRLLCDWARQRRPELVEQAKEQAQHLMSANDDAYLATTVARWFLEVM